MSNVLIYIDNQIITEFKKENKTLLEYLENIKGEKDLEQEEKENNKFWEGTEEEIKFEEVKLEKIKHDEGEEEFVEVIRK